jgi:hypothetical protein
MWTQKKCQSDEFFLKIKIKSSNEEFINEVH